MSRDRTLVPLVGLLSLVAAPALAQARVDPRVPAPQMLERPGVGKFDEPSVEPGRDLVAFELAWQKRDPEQVARRLASVIAAILGDDAGRTAKPPAYEEAGSWTRIADTPLLVKYDAVYDEIRVLHEELDLLAPARDIGIDGARDVAERFLKRLVDAAIVDPRLYEQAAIQVGYKRAGDGPTDKDVRPGRIVGYRVTYRPRLRGFQLANAGVRLGIAASGEVASVRVGGVTPVDPTRGSESKNVRVGTKELTDRLLRQATAGSASRIVSSRVLYVMPEHESRAVVEPMLVVSYAQVNKTPEGPVASRRQTIAYSLTDPAAAPLVFDRPAAGSEATEAVRGK